MKVLGIVAEYNPFHNGHKYHLEASKKLTKADFVVCVMSGNFIQRGEPALLNKWSRAKMAIANGIDLVIELPVSYVLASAEFFAFASVKILDSLNIVTDLCFGSEWGKIDDLQEIANILVNEPAEFSGELKKNLNSGENYAKAREKALVSYANKKNLNFSVKDIIAYSNNILGIEYLKALYKLDSSIKASCIKRYKAGYSSLEIKDSIASATAIRQILQRDSDITKIQMLMPSTSYEIFKEDYMAGKAPVFSKNFENTILTLLRKMNQDELASYPDVNEGLENRIKNSTMNCGTLEELISSIKTKRYTQTRLQRIMFNILLDIKKEQLNRFQKYDGPQYIRVLAMNSKGKKLLKAAKQKASLPIITKTASYKQSCNPLLKQMIELDLLATDLYTLAFPCPKQRKGKLDYLTSPIIY